MTHAEIKEDLPLFVLGTLDVGERRALQRHLATGCAECELDIVEWREVVALLALGDEKIEAPDLKASLLGKIETQTPLRAARWRPDWRLLLPLAAIFLLVIAAGLRDVQWRSRIDDQVRRFERLNAELDHSRDRAGDLREQLTTQRADLTAQLAAKEQELSELRSALAEAHAAIDLLQAPGLRLVRLRQPRDAKPAEGHALLNNNRGRAIFYAFDLPPVDADKTYELWWITAKKGPINAGLFRPDDRGLSRIEATLPADAGAITATAVTIEPASGVDKPSGPMVLQGDVTRG